MKGLSKGVEAARKMKFPEKHVKKALVSHMDDVLRREPGKGYPGIKKVVKAMEKWKKPAKKGTHSGLAPWKKEIPKGTKAGIRNADLRSAMKMSPGNIRQLERMQLDPRRLPMDPRRAGMFDDSVMVHGRRRPDHPPIPSPLTTFKGPKY